MYYELTEFIEKTKLGRNYDSYLATEAEKREKSPIVTKIKAIENLDVAADDLTNASAKLANFVASQRVIIVSHLYPMADPVTKKAMIGTCKAWTSWLLPEKEATPKLFKSYIKQINIKTTKTKNGNSRQLLRDGELLHTRNVIKTPNSKPIIEDVYDDED